MTHMYTFLVFLISLISLSTSQNYVCQSNVRTTTHKRGGTSIGQFSSDQACRVFCENSARCYSADYDYGTGLCWQHIDEPTTQADLVINTCCSHFYQTCQFENDNSGCTYNILHNAHRLGGVRALLGSTFTQCIRHCQPLDSCLSVDWEDATGACWVHTTKAIENGPTANIQTSNCCILWYKECPATPEVTTAAPSTDCVVQFLENRHLGGGEPYVDSILYDNPYICYSRCLADQTCASADWNRSQKTCSKFTTVTDPQSPSLKADSCCYHIIRSCPVEQTTAAVTTTTKRLPTSKPQVIIKTPNKFTGICPAEFGLQENYHIIGGTVVNGISDVEACRSYCLSQDDCFAADWNKNTNQCEEHKQDTITNKRVADPCCDHYRKTFCHNPYCYKHGPIEVLSTNPDMQKYLNYHQSVSIPNLETVECSTNVCYHNQEFLLKVDSSGVPTLSVMLERGCDTGGTMKTSKQCKTTPSTRECVCVGDRCNGLDTDLLSTCLGHYSLDTNGRDLTIHSRDGHVGSGVSFDYATAIKNGSAVFDGSQDAVIEIRDWTFLVPGFIESNGRVIAPFAVVLLMFRSRVEGEMTIVSNHEPGGASILLQSLPESSTEQIISGGVKIGGSFYGIQTKAALNQYAFIVMQYTEDDMGPKLTLITSFTSVFREVFDETVYLPVPRGQKIDYSTDSMLIGNQRDTSTNFEGNIDELMFFNNVVTFSQMKAIIYSSVNV